jgi:hypothetical protein
MIGRIRRPRDPFWDEGRGARRTQRRLRIEGLIALTLAIVACGVTAAVWLRTLAPLAENLGVR